MVQNLPKLTYKQQKFVMRYVQNGGNATEAYKFAYECSGMSNDTIHSEASKLLKHPKVAPWIEYYQNNLENFINEEIKYSVDDAFQELEELQHLSMQSSKTYNVAIKAIENKCKLKKLLADKIDISGGACVQMGTIEVDSGSLMFKIGEPANEDPATANT